MKAPSTTMCDALLAFAARGGSGVIDKRGGLVASGERLDYDAVTWLRLVVEGQIHAAGTFRLQITPQGWRGVDTLKKRRGCRVSPQAINAPTGPIRTPMLDEEDAA